MQLGVRYHHVSNRKLSLLPTKRFLELRRKRGHAVRWVVEEATGGFEFWVVGEPRVIVDFNTMSMMMAFDYRGFGAITYECSYPPSLKTALATTNHSR